MICFPPPPVERVTRDEIYKPGTYSSIPNGILARGDLTTTAKLVYGALAAHLRRVDATIVWPSVPRLAAMIAASPSAVTTAIAALEAVGLIDVDRGSGRASRYSFHPLPGQNLADPASESGQKMADSDTPTRPETGRRPSRNWPKAPANLAESPRESGHEVPKEVLEEEPKRSTVVASQESSFQSSPTDGKGHGDDRTEETAITLAPEAFAEDLLKLLQVGRGDIAQLRRDRKDFALLAVHLNAGRFGDRYKALDRIYDTAERIGRDRTVRNPAATFMAAIRDLRRRPPVGEILEIVA